MAIREFNFTVGPETSALPTVGDPSGDDDLITLGFADARYTQGSEAVADNTALKAIAEAERRDGDLVLVLDTNRLYRFDSAAADADDGNLVLEPSAGTGRWHRVSILQEDVRFTGTTESSDKDTGAMVLEGGLGVEKSVNVGIDLNVTGDTVLTGDLTVNGTTTTVNTETLDVEDPNIGVNRGGNQATADSAVSGVTVQMTDATDARIGYDSALTSKFKAGESGSESELITASGAQTFTGIKQSNPGIEFDTLSATPAASAANYLKLYAKDDGKFYYIDESGLESEVGAGSGLGEVNYIENFGGESDTSGWATYADAAQATPEDGTGGTANIVFSTQNTEVLRGNQSFKIAKDAANRQGEGVSYDFAIKGQDTNKKLKIQFDFKSDEDADYAAGYLGVYIYDVTNSQIITPVDTDLVRGQNIFQTSFVSTGSLSYRLIFHVATDTTTAWDVYIDNVIVGPGAVSQGAAVGGTTTETSIWTGATSDPTKGTTAEDFLTWSRVGEFMEIHLDYRQTAAGSSGSGRYYLTVPNGQTIDTDYYGDATSFTNYARVGAFSTASAADGLNNGIVGVDTATRFVFFTHAGTALANTTYDFFTESDGRFTCNIRVKIAEWAGQGIVPMLSEDNLSEWKSYAPTINDRTGSTSLTYSTQNGSWRRVGENMQVSGQVVLDVVTTGTGNPTVVMPAGYTIDAAKVGDLSAVGHGVFFDSSVSEFKPFLIYPDTTTGRTNEVLCLESTSVALPALATGDQFRFWFEVPITEWAGSQNSLVGYAEATPENVGLIKSNKWQTKKLTSDVTTNTTMSDLTFNNLTIGNLYRVSLQALIIASANDNVQARIIHNSSELAVLEAGDDASNTAKIRSTIHTSAVFKATATTVTFTSTSIGAGSQINGNNTFVETFSMIEELNNYENETTDFT